MMYLGQSMYFLTQMSIFLLCLVLVFFLGLWLGQKWAKKNNPSLIINPNQKNANTLKLSSKQLNQLKQIIQKANTEEAYKTNLLAIEEKIKEKITKSYGQEKRILEQELSEIQLNLLNIRTSYEKKINSLASQIQNLAGFDEEVLALSNGDEKKAKELFVQSIQISMKKDAEAYYNLALIDERNINYYAAYDSMRMAVELDGDNPDYLNQSGVLSFYLGEFDRAINYYGQSIQIRQKQLGLNTDAKNDASQITQNLTPNQIAISMVNLATSYHNLGGAHQAKGEIEKAIEYHQKSLEIRQKYSRDKPIEVANSYNELGKALYLKGEYDKAIEYHQKSLMIKRRKKGADHPDVASGYNDLGLAFHAKGDISKSVEYFDKALGIWQKGLGDEHPNVAQGFNNLGEVALIKGELSQAIEYFERALQIWKTQFGDNHPNVALCYNNLGEVLQAQSQFDEAIDYFKKSLVIRQEKLGKDHPNVATCFNNLGLAYYAKDDYDKAIEYFEKSLEIRQVKLGNEHPDVAKSYRNLGLAYHAKGEDDKVIEFIEGYKTQTKPKRKKLSRFFW